jgi:hypothetical protein
MKLFSEFDSIKKSTKLKQNGLKLNEDAIKTIN